MLTRVLENGKREEVPLRKMSQKKRNTNLQDLKSFKNQVKKLRKNKS